MNGESRLKVLRAVVALKEFTTRDVMGWTHLKRGQVIPRLADLRKEKIIEYDLEYGPKEAAEKADVIRPAHRPIQHYRLSLESANRQKAFAEIGRVRSLFGEDPLAHKLAVIEGRLKELAKQLESIKNQKDIIDRKRYADYEASLSDTGVSLDEAILEMDIEDKSLGSKLSQLRKLHQKLQSELLELRSKPVQVHETDRIRELLPSFFHHIKGQPFTLPQLETVENDLKPIMVQMQELYDMLGLAAPDYTPEARLEYAYSKIAAETMPESGLLLSTTEHLAQIAPESHRSSYEYNRANLLAWHGKDEAAFEPWSRSVGEISSRAQDPFQIIIGAVVDRQRISETTWEELTTAARESHGVIAMASKDLVTTIPSLPSSSAAVLSDPIYGTMEVANERIETKYAVYGENFKNVFRAQPGISYSRLATTLYKVGVSRSEAWNASRQVNAGKVLVLFGDLHGSMHSNERAKMRFLLETKLGAQVLDLSATPIQREAITKYR